MTTVCTIPRDESYYNDADEVAIRDIIGANEKIASYVGLIFRGRFNCGTTSETDLYTEPGHDAVLDSENCVVWEGDEPADQIIDLFSYDN